MNGFYRQSTIWILPIQGFKVDKREISLIKNTVSNVLKGSKIELNRIVLFGSYASLFLNGQQDRQV